MKTVKLEEPPDIGSSYVLRGALYDSEYLRDLEVVITHERPISKAAAHRILGVLYPQHAVREVTVEVI